MIIYKQKWVIISEGETWANDAEKLWVLYLGSVPLLDIVDVKDDGFLSNKKLYICLILLHVTIKWLKKNYRTIWLLKSNECQKNA